MIFPTSVNGVPCKCHVTHYTPFISSSWSSPPQYAEFEFELLDVKGRRATWLDKYITQEVEDRLFEEHHIELQAMEREDLDV